MSEKKIPDDPIACFSGTVVIVDTNAERRQALARAWANPGVHVVCAGWGMDIGEQAQYMDAVTSSGAVARCVAENEASNFVKSVMDDFAHIDLIFIQIESAETPKNQKARDWLKAVLPHLKKGRPHGLVGLLRDGDANMPPRAIEQIRESIGAIPRRPLIVDMPRWEKNPQVWSEEALERVKSELAKQTSKKPQAEDV
ncbi:MAG: hypothetical protein ACOC2L_01450 [Candidatus Sumerlaeota bacterium]